MSLLLDDAGLDEMGEAVADRHDAEHGSGSYRMCLDLVCRAMARLIEEQAQQVDDWEGDCCCCPDDDEEDQVKGDQVDESKKSDKNGEGS